MDGNNKHNERHIENPAGGERLLAPSTCSAQIDSDRTAIHRLVYAGLLPGVYLHTKGRRRVLRIREADWRQYLVTRTEPVPVRGKAPRAKS